MNTDLHTIKTAGKKDMPDGTATLFDRGTLPGTGKVKLKLPGQQGFSDLGDNLPIIDGVLELPVRLLFFSYAREDAMKARNIANRMWQEGYLTWIDNKDLLPGD